MGSLASAHKAHEALLRVQLAYAQMSDPGS
jgi:hypothetical protein